MNSTTDPAEIEYRTPPGEGTSSRTTDMRTLSDAAEALTAARKGASFDAGPDDASPVLAPRLGRLPAASRC